MAKSGLPMKTIGGPHDAAAAAGAGGGLAKLFQRTAHNHVPLQAREIIDEQHPVEMVDLMLHTGGKKTFACHHLFFAIDIQIAHIDAGGTFDLGCLLRDRQAAFLESPWRRSGRQSRD